MQNLKTSLLFKPVIRLISTFVGILTFGMKQSKIDANHIFDFGMKYVDHFYSVTHCHRVHFWVIMMLAMLNQTTLCELRNHALAKTNLITTSFNNSRPFALHAFTMQ